ncbi:MAG: class I SAM-dependent rRNA methyltransferase [Pseudomonadota bacterium]
MRTPGPRQRPPRPAARGEGRLGPLVLPRSAHTGDLIAFPVDDQPHLLLVEGDADLVAWDLGVGELRALPELLATRVECAFERRRALVPPDTTVYRAVHDAADGLPGVTVDVYGDTALVQTYGAAYRRHAEALGQAVQRQRPSVRVVERVRHGGRAGDLDRWFGPPRHDVIVLEEGMRFRVRLDDTQLGTGLFADQRAQRRRVRELARGRRVLNLFAHAGGFTVAAALGGCARIDHVDLSQACLRWAAENLVLNGQDPRRHRFLAEDARDWVARALRRHEHYDLIIVDPPAFASGRQVFRVERDLPVLLEACLPLLAAHGVLLACANARGLAPDFIERAAVQAGQRCARPVLVVGPGDQGADHPWTEPGGVLHHLRAAWLLAAPA